MTRLAEALKVVLLGWWLLVSVGLGWWGLQLKPKVEGLITDVDRTVVIFAGAGTNVEKASRAWEKASGEQSLRTSQAMSNVSAAAGQLSKFISATDESFNSRLIPEVQSTLLQQNALLAKSQESLQLNLSALLTTTQELQKTLADADQQISSPDVKIALDNFATSSANLATATHEGAAMLADAHQVEDYEIKQIEAPVTKVKVVWHVVLDIIRHLYF